MSPDLFVGIAAVTGMMTVFFAVFFVSVVPRRPVEQFVRIEPSFPPTES